MAGFGGKVHGNEQQVDGNFDVKKHGSLNYTPPKMTAGTPETEVWFR